MRRIIIVIILMISIPMIVNAVEKVKLTNFLNSTVNSNIKVRIEWKTTTTNPIDLDLELISPSGERLYWDNKQVEWGIFTHDELGNKNGIAFEELYLDCLDALIEDSGQYKFRVNYWGGNKNKVNVKLVYWYNGKKYTNLKSVDVKHNNREPEDINIVFDTKRFVNNKIQLNNTSYPEIILQDKRKYISFKSNSTMLSITKDDYGFDESISYLKKKLIYDNKKTKVLVLVFHANKAYISWNKNEIMCMCNGGNNQNTNYLQLRDNVIKNKWKRLGKYFDRTNGLPHILFFACEIGNNVTLLKAIAKETNTVVHANSHFTGERQASWAKKLISGNWQNWDLDVVVFPDGHVEHK